MNKYRKYAQWYIEQLKRPGIIQERAQNLTARFGPRNYLNRVWREQWLIEHGHMRLAINIGVARVAFRDIMKSAIVWGLLLSPIVVLLFVGVLFGHFVWK